MKTILMLTLVGFFTMFATQSIAQESELIKQLMDGADVSKTQAMGGAGALFGLARENMSKEDFKKVEDAVPEMGDLLDAVPSVGGGKTSMLGSVAKTITGMPKVVAAFDELGISQDKVALFTPILVNYVEEKGGKAISSLLGKAMQ